MIGNECPFINDGVTTNSGHFFEICMIIFHKTEVQTVIMTCLTGLNSNKFWLVQKLRQKMEIFPFPFFCNFVQKHKNARNANACFCTKYLLFVSYPLNQLEFRPIKHIKMTVWTSVLWKITIQLAKKWPEMVVKKVV